MKFFRILLLFCLGPLMGSEFNDLKLHSLYLMQQDQVEASLEKYREYTSFSGHHDFEILQQLGYLLLQRGIQSQDKKICMMTLLGAGLSGSSKAIEILEKGTLHQDPEIQLLSLHFLSRIEDDRIADILNRAMSSEYLGIRMEAVFYLAQKKHPHAIGHLESLMYRLPPAFKPYFPSLFALLGTNDAAKALRRLLEDPDPQTRIESILNLARTNRDDFLPMLRKKLTHNHIAEVEASLFAIGMLKDSHSLVKVKKLTKSPIDLIRLAASMALIELGDRSPLPIIIELAEQNNLFAISALGSISGTEPILRKLILSKDFQVRTNAAIALLQRHDAASLQVLPEILIQDERSLAFQPFRSLGRSLLAIKGIPSAQLHAKDPSFDLNYSQVLREQFLKEAIHLPEKAFLRLASLIFEKKQLDLVPMLITLLENLQTDSAIKLLKKGAKKMGCPFIRDYCHLALYRLDQGTVYEEYMNRWIMHQKQAELIQMKQLLPWKYRLEQSDYTLTAEETSRLLIETFLSMASKRDEKSIDFLLKAMQLGNIKNRYALMGLLMKTTE